MNYCYLLHCIVEFGRNAMATYQPGELGVSMAHIAHCSQNATYSIQQQRFSGRCNSLSPSMANYGQHHHQGSHLLPYNMISAIDTRPKSGRPQAQAFIKKRRTSEFDFINLCITRNFCDCTKMNLSFFRQETKGKTLGIST